MSSSSTLTDLTNAQIYASVSTIYGKVTSRPALLVTDGTNIIYACDVDVGVLTPDGRYDQTTTSLTGVPGSQHYTYTDQEQQTVGTILRNVPISRNNGELMYADIGNPVILTRSASGQFQVTGFSQELPGTRTRYAVDLGNLGLGPITSLSVTGRMLTLGELGTLGPGFGTTPFGASALFIGGVLQEITQG